MAFVDELREQNERLKEIESRLPKKEEKELKGWKFKIPMKVKRAALKEAGKAAAFYISANRTAEWKVAAYRDGNWVLQNGKDENGKVREEHYAYEEAAVFPLRQGSKQIPVIIILQWRLLGVGGKAEEYRSRIIGGETDEDAATALGIKSFGQQTIKRMIEQAELKKDEKKGMNLGWLIWVAVGGAALFIIYKMFMS
jgi:hypothetical protein